MPTKISDQTYGYLFAILYFIPVIFFESGENEFQKSKTAFQLIIIFIIGACFLTFYNMLENKIFKRGLFEGKADFNPLKYLFKNKADILFVEIVTYIQILILVYILWIFFQSHIVRYFFKINQGIVWFGTLCGLLFLAIYLLFKKINLSLYKKIFKTNSILNKEQDINEDEYDKLKMDILGKNVSDAFSFSLILLFGIGGIFLFTFKLIHFIQYWAVLFTILLFYNIFYVIKKTDKFLLTIILIGSFPFGFIIPAFLPRTSIKKI